MAERVSTNAKIWVHGYDLSGDANAIASDYGVQQKDGTTFGNGGIQRFRPGLRTFGVGIEGLWDADGTDEPHDVFFTRLGLPNIPISWGPETGADGEVAHTFLAELAEYSPKFEGGELAAFSVRAEAGGDYPLVSGRILHHATRAATGNGTSRQLGLVAAGKRIYIATHVIAASGTTPTLDIVLESDNDTGFASATSRIVVPQFAAIGADFSSLAGAIATDDWWRITYTIGGTGPSFKFVCVVGIL